MARQMEGRKMRSRVGLGGRGSGRTQQLQGRGQVQGEQRSEGIWGLRSTLTLTLTHIIVDRSTEGPRRGTG